MKRFLFLSSLAALVIAPTEGATLVVDSHMYLYLAGGNPGSGGGGGNAPASFSFAAAPGQTIVFSSVTGTTDCDGGAVACAPTGPDGNLGSDALLAAVGTLSGINVRGSFSLPLWGVFLDNGLPGSAPPTLDFRNAENFTTSGALLLGQLFWIGDGLTGTGSGTPQTFLLPNTATRLFLGFGDLFAGDNSGQLTATFSLNTPSAGVPEPGSAMLLGIGLALVLGAWRATR